MYQILYFPDSLNNELNVLCTSYIMVSLFTNRKSSKVSTIKRASYRLSHNFSSSPSPWCLAFDLSLGVFSVPGIYIDPYVYDDVYICLLVNSYFHTSNMYSGYNILGIQGPNISFPHNFTKTYAFKTSTLFWIQLGKIFPYIQ